MKSKRRRSRGAAPAPASPPAAVAVASRAAAPVTPWWHRWLLTLACLAVFGPALGHGFLSWDDTTHILGQAAIHPPDPRRWGEIWNAPIFNMYVPVTYTLWALANALSHALTGRAHPAVFHALPLLAHIAGTWLVHALLLRLLRRREPGTPPVVVLLGALLFAVHPLQVQAVAWISALRDTLSTALGLGAVLLLLPLCDRGRIRAGARPTRYGAALLLFVLALLSKPSAVAIPLVLALLAHAIYEVPLRGLVWPLAPFGAAALAVVLGTRALQPEATLTVEVPWIKRPVVALDALSWYARTLVAPIRLLADEGRRPDRLFAGREVLVSWIVPVASAAATLVLRKRLPWLAVGIAFATLSLLPVLGLVPFAYQGYSTVADHYAYLALVGIALAVCGSLGGPRLRTQVVVVSALLAVLGARSAIQVRVWRDEVTLFTPVLAAGVPSHAAENSIGRNLQDKGDVEGALRHYRAALDLDPGNAVSLNNIGETLYGAGRHGEVVSHFEAAFQRWVPRGNSGPMFSRMHTNLAASLFHLGRTDAALRELETALQLDPRNEHALHNKGAILLNLGRAKEAMPWLERAVELAPASALFRTNRDLARKSLGTATSH